MGRKRTLNRMDYRSDTDEEFENEEEEADEDEDDEDSSDDDEESPEEEVEEEVKPAPKPKRATRAKKPTKKSPRMKVVWGVFDNSNKRVATFDYAKQKEANAHAKELHEKKGEIYFVQPVKEAMEE